jgi:hypothetical protein
MNLVLSEPVIIWGILGFSAFGLICVVCALVYEKLQPSEDDEIDFTRGDRL